MFVQESSTPIAQGGGNIPFSCAGDSRGASFPIRARAGESRIPRATWVQMGLILALAAVIGAHLWLLPAMVHPPPWRALSDIDYVSPAYLVWNGLERRLVLAGAAVLLLSSLVPLLWLRRHRFSARIGAGLAALGALAVLGVTLWSPPRLAPHLGLPRWSFDGALHGLLLLLSAGALLWTVARGGRRRRVAGWVTGGAALAVVTLLLVPRPAESAVPYALLRYCDPVYPIIRGNRQCWGDEQNPPRDRAVPLGRIPLAVDLRRQTRRMLTEQLAYFASGACCCDLRGEEAPPPPPPPDTGTMLWWIIMAPANGLTNGWFFLVWQDIRWIALALAVLTVPLWALLGVCRRRGSDGVRDGDRSENPPGGPARGPGGDPARQRPDGSDGKDVCGTPETNPGGPGGERCVCTRKANPNRQKRRVFFLTIVHRVRVVLAGAIGVLAAVASMPVLPEVTYEPLWKHVPTALWVPLAIALLVALVAWTSPRSAEEAPATREAARGG